MKYIEIADGLSIKIDEIEAVSNGEDNLTSIVKTHHNIYRSTFPYDVLIGLLEQESSLRSEDTELKDMQRKQLNILKEMNVFAG